MFKTFILKFYHAVSVNYSFIVGTDLMKKLKKKLFKMFVGVNKNIVYI